nr:hypothetical protein BaRGS_008336 [Batillaria attramentaria]
MASAAMTSAVTTLLALHVTTGADTEDMLAAQMRSYGKGLVLVGGNLYENNSEISDTIVTMAYYYDLLVTRYGAASGLHINVSIWDSSFASDPTLVDQIRNLTGFFFTGEGFSWEALKGGAKVIGENGVTFFDLTSSFVDTSQRYFSIRDVYLTYLTHGDVYNLHTHDVTFSPDKIPLKGNESLTHAFTSDNIFHGKSDTPGRKPEFVRLATSIFDARLDTSTYGTTQEDNPRFRAEMSRAGREAVGYVKRVNDFHSDRHSYKDMYVAIHED